MSDVAFVNDRTVAAIRFDQAPVYNALCSLCLLTQEVDNISPWVERTQAALTDSDKHAAETACAAMMYVRGSRASDLPAWIDEFRSRSPDEVVSVAFERMAYKARTYLGDSEAPSAEELRSDQAAFMAFASRMAAMYEKPFDEAETAAEYQRYLDPAGYQHQVADAVEHLWSAYLADEWSHAAELTAASVRAFRSIELPGKTFEDRLKFITQRDYIPEVWVNAGTELKELVYIPSPHIGPYMIEIDRSETTAWIVGRARIPEESNVRMPELDRSDVLMRLEAISDANRLHIMEMAAKNGTITTQEVMEKLGLSQSSASRHLTQLGATGLLIVDAHEKTKRYRLNGDRVDETLGSLKGLLKQ